jgi:hypothetical protein
VDAATGQHCGPGVSIKRTGIHQPGGANIDPVTVVRVKVDTANSGFIIAL